MLDRFTPNRVTSVTLLSSREATEASFNMLSPAGKAVASCTAREALELLGDRKPEILSGSGLIQRAFVRGCGTIASEFDMDMTPSQLASELPAAMGHEFQSAINVGASVAYHNAKMTQMKGVLGTIGKIGLVGLGVATGLWLG